MTKKLPTLEKRRRVVERTMQRFAGKAFKLGSNDCVKMMKFHAVQMGHKLPSTGHYTTEKEAVRQLKKQGARNVEQVMDKLFERIPPASMLLGDFAMPPSDPEAEANKLGTILIKVAPLKYLGWHPEHEFPVIMDISQIEAAWRA
jgi:hypothetical protein